MTGILVAGVFYAWTEIPRINKQISIRDPGELKKVGGIHSPYNQAGPKVTSYKQGKKNGTYFGGKIKPWLFALCIQGGYITGFPYKPLLLT